MEIVQGHLTNHKTPKFPFPLPSLTHDLTP
jgi:hypothetical protein